MTTYQLLTTIPRNDLKALARAGLLAPTALTYISVYDSVSQRLARGDPKMGAYMGAALEHGYTDDHVRKILRYMNQETH